MTQLRFSLTGVARSILQPKNGHDWPYPSSQQEKGGSYRENEDEGVDADVHDDGARSTKNA